nr:helix-turn-helix domain-containing protein [Erysipelotrichaceae bacterium]
MILADKIIENRKRNGWSQEELADMLDVSRQSVSKWESAQSVPDMKKIIQLSQIFGVTTDYLLKDDLDAADFDPTVSSDSFNEKVRSVSMEEANAFLQFNEKASLLISVGVMLCILSPVPLLFLN